MFITDQVGKVLEKYPLIINEDNVVPEHNQGINAPYREQDNKYNYLNRIVQYNSNFYALIKDILYRIEMNQLTAIAIVPYVRCKEVIQYNYGRLCIIENTLIITDNQKFYKLQSDNSLVPIQLLYKQKEIVPQYAYMFDFNNHATISAFENNRWSIFEFSSLNESNLIYMNDVIIMSFNSQGIQVIKVNAQSSYLVLDYSQSNLVKRFCFESELKIEFIDGNFTYQTEQMANLIKDYSDQKLRVSQIMLNYPYTQISNIQQIKNEEEVEFFNEICLSNRYQIENHIIFYKKDCAIITDINRVVVFKTKLLYKMNSDIKFSHHSNEKLWLNNNKLYTLINNVLVNVDLFTVTEVLTNPGTTNSSSNQLCMYQNQLLITNQQQFFVMEGDQLTVKEFVLNGQCVKSEKSRIYSFGTITVAYVDINGRNLIIQLNDDKCTVLYCSKIIPYLAVSGLWIMKIAECQFVVVDLTKQKPEILFSLDEIDITQISQTNNHYDFDSLVLKKLVDSEYIQRRDQIYKSECEKVSISLQTMDEIKGKFEQFSSTSVYEDSVIDTNSNDDYEEEDDDDNSDNDNSDEFQDLDGSFADDLL
ncbi:Conserved_hypothetical protein [Hexamita inflata]|uniref:Uncharacterized protein n=1 Tax=Hexamita inflata TaxID=28002 RepID=A0ABP1IKL2_9EUKA